MESLLDIDLRCIEPELSYLEFLQPSRRRPTYWNNLGSSKNRTPEQENQVRLVIDNLIQDIDPNAVIAFTDGSCQGNPGPCGSGSCVYLPNGERIELKQPVSKSASILLGELIAIKITLDYILVEKQQYNYPNLHIFSDSQTVIGILTLGWTNKSYTTAVQDVKNLWKTIEAGGTKITLDWSPGHADIVGNEIADRLAKDAAAEAGAIENDNSEPITKEDIKKAAKKSVSMLLQRRWDTAGQDKSFHNFKANVKLNQMDFIDNELQRIFLQLHTGHCNLKEHRYKVGLDSSPYCECGYPESVEHFLMDCKITENFRELMKGNIYMKTGIRDIDLRVLLTSGDDDKWKEYRATILDELTKFIKKTQRFVITL